MCRRARVWREWRWKGVGRAVRSVLLHWSMLPRDSCSGRIPRWPVVPQNEAYGLLPILLGALLSALLSSLHLGVDDDSQSYVKTTRQIPLENWVPDFVKVVACEGCRRYIGGRNLKLLPRRNYFMILLWPQHQLLC